MNTFIAKNNIITMQAGAEPESTIPKFSAANYRMLLQTEVSVLKKMTEWSVLTGKSGADKSGITDVVFDITGGKLILVGINGAEVSACAEPVRAAAAKKFTIDAEPLARIVTELKEKGDFTIFAGRAAILFKWGGNQVYIPLTDRESVDCKNAVPKSYNSDTVIRWYIRGTIKGQ